MVVRVFSRKPNEISLRPGERIVYSFNYRSRQLVATNNRLVILSKGSTQDEFDYNYIAHMNLGTENKYRLWGILLMVLGLFYMIAAQSILSVDASGSGGVMYPIIPILFLIAGIVLFRMKEHTLYIHLSGVTQTFEYKLPGRVYDDAQRLISVISEERRKQK